MSVETMIQGITAEASREADRLLIEADQRAAAIIGMARAAVDARVQAACDRLGPGFRAEAARTVNAARLRLLERRAELAAERIDAVFRVADEQLERIADGEDGERWERSLSGLLEEALAEVGAGATIVCRDVDAALLARMGAARRAGLAIVRAPDAAPGLIARSADGSLEIEATIPARLGRARVLLVERVARMVGLEA
jgi:vacuolar-type H+-ATPase subunit E/Vma4